MKAICKVKTEQLGKLYDDLYGVAVVVKLEPEQIWAVTKSHGYYYAKRGTTKLRLTPTAFNKLFEIKEAQND